MHSRSLQSCFNDEFVPALDRSAPDGIPFLGEPRVLDLLRAFGEIQQIRLDHPLGLGESSVGVVGGERVP